MRAVTHETEFAREVAHRVIVADDGRIVADATGDDRSGRPRPERAPPFPAEILSH